MMQLSRRAAWLLASALLLTSIILFGFSWNHPISADLAMLHYSAWLINEQHFVLYRDIFDINFPAPYLLHSLLGELLGYESLPLRIVDLFLMITLGWASWKILAPLSKPAAITGFSLFSLLYWMNGGEFVLERDVLALVFAAVAFAIATTTDASRKSAAWIGLFAALACSMKPNTVVAVPVLLWMLHRTPRNHPTAGNTAPMMSFLASASITAIIPFAWMVYRGGWQSFLDIYRHYLPIYANSRYDLWHYDSSYERWSTLGTQFLQFGGLSLALAAPGLAWAWTCHRQNLLQQQRLKQLAAITIAFTFYEVLAGKFWTNHLFPSAYWSFLCFSLLLTTPAPQAASRQKALAIFLLLPCALLGWQLGSFSLPAMQRAYQQTEQHPEAWRAQEVATHLKQQLQQQLQQQQLHNTDTVQVLDMAGDGQAALLLARATSATRFLIDVPLWMQPDSATTQTLRQQFVAELAQKNPAYIVYFEQFLHPGGGNRLKEFKALHQWIQAHYDISAQREGAYIIFRRRAVTP